VQGIIKLCATCNKLSSLRFIRTLAASPASHGSHVRCLHLVHSLDACTGLVSWPRNSFPKLLCLIKQLALAANLHTASFSLTPLQAPPVCNGEGSPTCAHAGTCFFNLVYMCVWPLTSKPLRHVHAAALCPRRCLVSSAWAGVAGPTADGAPAATLPDTRLSRGHLCLGQQ